MQLLSSNSPIQPNTKFNYYQVLKNGSDDSNGSDDEIINLTNSETRTSQVLFVGIILNY